jgi:hypothetical protein
VGRVRHDGSHTGRSVDRSAAGAETSIFGLKLGHAYLKGRECRALPFPRQLGRLAVPMSALLFRISLLVTAPEQDPETKDK